MGAKILVVDRNEAFSTMLREMLETGGGYQVQTARRGSEGLGHLRRAAYDLTIVDVDLDPADMAYDELIARVRQIDGSMRIVLIPLMGESLPESARRFDIQGTLSKPFFADDLLPGIRDALSRQVVRPATPPPQAAPAARPAPKGPSAPALSPPRAASRPRAAAPGRVVQEVLSDLARETQADAVLLASFANAGCSVLAHAGSLGDDQADSLALICVDAIEAAAAAAHLLGQDGGPFEHHTFESDALRLCVATLPAGHLLIVVTPGSTPLGTIRHNLRRARRDLASATLT